MALVNEVTRELARSGKKTVKQDVVDVIEASCTEEEFREFKEFLKEHEIRVVEQEH